MKSPPVGDHSSHQEESEVGWAFVLQASVVGPGAVWRGRVLCLPLTGCVAQVLLRIVRLVMPRRVGVGDIEGVSVVQSPDPGALETFLTLKT